jgi:hypothetical protein
MAVETHTAEPHPEADRPPIIEPGHSFASVTDQISSIVLTRGTPRGWYFGFAIAFSITMMLFYSLGYLVVMGVGIWARTFPSAGPSTSSISCGGSASDTPERSFPRFCCYSARRGGPRSIASRRR